MMRWTWVPESGLRNTIVWTKSGFPVSGSDKWKMEKENQGHVKVEILLVKHYSYPFTVYTTQYNLVYIIHI